jgi:cytochrome c oxidase cbb3-type subunit I/II
MVMLGVPYGEAVNRAPQMAREQAAALARTIEGEGGPKGLDDKQIIALVAYLQRLGKDIKAPQVAAGRAP